MRLCVCGYTEEDDNVYRWNKKKRVKTDGKMKNRQVEYFGYLKVVTLL